METILSMDRAVAKLEGVDSAGKRRMSIKHKYPRTLHLPWSCGVTDDDVTHQTIDHWVDREIVVTIKMDGENTSIYIDAIHARSLDSRNHPSRNWVKKHATEFQHEIPDGWRICGENLYASHSIHYTGLQSYFYGFSIWDDKNMCLSWDDTVEWFKLLNITLVPVIYIGIYDEEMLKSLNYNIFKDNEGYVLRLRSSFHYSDFGISTGKSVRPNHVQTSEHWMFESVIPNELMV